MEVKKALERRIQVYPPERYHKMFLADCYLKAECPASLAAKIIKDHYNSMTEQERRALSMCYNEMTPEQRKKPGKG